MFAQEKCPYGTYSTTTTIGSTTTVDCVPCDLGYACEGAGNFKAPTFTIQNMLHETPGLLKTM